MRVKQRIAGWLAVLACTAGLLAGCSRERIHQQESYVFGTRVELTVVDADAEPDRVNFLSHFTSTPCRP